MSENRFFPILEISYFWTFLDYFSDVKYYRKCEKSRKNRKIQPKWSLRSQDHEKIIRKESWEQNPTPSKIGISPHVQ